MNASAHISLALALVAAAGVAACGSGSIEKSGAGVDPPVTVTLEMPDAGDRLGVAFAAAVTRRTKGSVRVKLGSAYGNNESANELRLARALEAGRADIGYLPARAWSAAGIPAFQALLAPFVVTTDEAAQALAAGAIARDVLAVLPHSVVGLALVPAESRRVLAVRPPLTPAAFSGLRLRIFDDPQSAAAFEALGATVVQGVTARDATDALERREIDGVESAPLPILNNAYGSYARHLSGYAIFPKFQSIVVSRAAWRRLTGAQQAAVRAAAEETVRAAPAVVAPQEAAELGHLCRAGARISVATRQQLERLAAAAAPAVARLASDKVAARVLAAMGRLAGAGPQPLASPLPPACTQRPPANEPPPQTTGPTIPEGVYVTTVTPAQFRMTGADAPKFEQTWTIRTRFRDGRWTQTVKPIFPDECVPACSGTYRVDGDRVTLVWSEPPGATETLRWSYFDGVLQFKPVDVTDPGERAIVGQPWRKAG